VNRNGGVDASCIGGGSSSASGLKTGGTIQGGTKRNHSYVEAYSKGGSSYTIAQIKKHLKNPSKKTVGGVFTLLAALWILKIMAGSVLNPLRHLLETVEIRADNPKHYLYFYVASQLMFIPSPLPFIITAWVLAAGYFFKWRGFLLLFLSFGTGIPLSFQVGRILKNLGFNVRKYLKSGSLSGGLEYFDKFRRLIVEQPVRMCFLLMWAPVPTQLLPFLVGFLTDVSIRNFSLGAIPSKLIHFSCPLIIGLEASSLSSALNGESTSTLSVVVLILPVVMSIGLLAGMAYYVKGKLEEMKNGAQDDETYVNKLIV